MAKKEKKPKKPNQVWTLYDKDKRKNQSCPKCGAGIFLAAHKDRLTCGKCHYMEKISKPEKPAEK